MNTKFDFETPAQLLIHWNGDDGAKEMIEKYLNHPSPLMTKNDEPLEYIRIKLQDIQELLGIETTDEQKEVLLFFGVSVNDLDEPNPDKQSFTLIMASAECVDGNLVIKTDRVYNKFDPCPEKCLQYAIQDDRPSGAVAGSVCSC